MTLANLSVAKKLIAAFSILGLVILVSGGIAILQTTRIEDAATISDRIAQQAKSVNAVLAEAAKMQAAIRGLLITGSSTYGKEYEALGGQMDAAIQTALDVLLQVKDNVKNNADSVADTVPPPPARTRRLRR